MSKRYSAVHPRERAQLRRRTRAASLVVTVKRARPRTLVSERGRLRHAVGARDAAGGLTALLSSSGLPPSRCALRRAGGTRGPAPNGWFRLLCRLRTRSTGGAQNAVRYACRNVADRRSGSLDVRPQAASEIRSKCARSSRIFDAAVVRCNAGQPASSLYLACRSPAWYRPRPKATN